MPADITTERLLAAVTWEWQKAEDLMELLIPTVAPGKAKRTYENRMGKYVKGNTARPQLTEDEQIASGARAIVNDRIGSQAESGRIEVKTEDGERWVRFRERREVANRQGCCPTCNRPFPSAPETKPQAPAPKTNVRYPSFPQWQEQEQKLVGEGT